VDRKEELIALIEEAKADLVRRHEALKRMPVQKPRAWVYWMWFFALLIMALACAVNTAVAMHNGQVWSMIHAYVLVMANVVTLTVHYENYRSAMVEHIKREGEMALLDRFAKQMLASYDEDIAKLRAEQ